MKKKDIIPFLCLLFAIGALTQTNFGFVPLDSAEALGRDIVPTIAFVGTFWFVYNLIKNRGSKDKNKLVAESSKVENK
jgi:hypothetical protein